MGFAAMNLTEKPRRFDAPPPGRKTNRRMPARECPIRQDQPIEIAKLWRDRNGTAIIIALRSYKERPFLDLRTFLPTTDGKLAPSQKGLTLPLRKIAEVAKALEKAIERARELGLLDGDDDAGAR
jgi:hypothetical protein